MSDPIQPPAPHPCGSCPYRRDVPSGVWHDEEYAKLPEFDREIGEQPPVIFLCHQQNGRACSGWCAVHDMEESLGFRLAGAMGNVEDPAPFLDYETTTPLFETGAEAAAHGRAQIEQPDQKARKTIDKLMAKGKVHR